MSLSLVADLQSLQFSDRLDSLLAYVFFPALFSFREISMLECVLARCFLDGSLRSIF